MGLAYLHAGRGHSRMGAFPRLDRRRCSVHAGRHVWTFSVWFFVSRGFLSRGHADGTVLPGGTLPGGLLELDGKHSHAHSGRPADAFLPTPARDLRMRPVAVSDL